MPGVEMLGVGHPNLELTTDFREPAALSRWFTVHMLLELTAAEATLVEADLRKPKRTDLKKRLKDIIDDKYSNLKGGKELIDGIKDEP